MNTDAESPKTWIEFYTQQLDQSKAWYVWSLDGSCHAKTKKKHYCMNPVKRGVEFCWRHRPVDILDAEILYDDILDSEIIGE